MTTSPLWTVDELTAAVSGTLAGAEPATPVTGLSIDSRTLKAGDAFFAIAGETFDGHDFAAAARDKGAALLVLSRRPETLPADAPVLLVDDALAALQRLGRAARARAKARIVGITGSVGKTSTKEALAHVLAEQAPTHWSTASFNNHWGVPLSLARMPRETVFGIFELGMNHAGEIAALTGMVRPHAAVITAIEPAHLEFFSGVEAIADAKAEIFLGIDPGGTAILNRDNGQFDRLAGHAEARGLAVRAFGADGQAADRLETIRLDPASSAVEAVIGGRKLRYTLGVPGRHHALNSLAVLAAADVLGGDVEAAAARLATLPDLAGRGQHRPIAVAGGEATLIDESYNASPAAMRAAFAVLGNMPAAGRRIAVLGDMRELGGDAPELHRSLAGALVAAGVDRVFTCGPLMLHLYEALPAGIAGSHAVDAAALAPVIADFLRVGDIVMVKGSLGSRMADIVKPLLAGEAGRGGVRSR